MELYKRTYYLKKIRGFYHDYEMIKVITGIRRCGKSCLMRTITEELLKAHDVTQSQIIYINLDDKENKSIKTGEQLEKRIDELSITKKPKYLFIDEIQNVKDFEEIINAYREEGDYSIFITASNSYLLSGELITKLTGRYVEFELFTLSFSEYIEMKRFYNLPVNQDIGSEFTKYILEGGFPKTIFYNNSEDRVKYLQSIIDEIFKKDIRYKHVIRNASVFDRVKAYIINNFGATVNITRILDYFRNEEGLIIKRETLNKYIELLENAKIIYKCQRFDLKSRRSLAGEQKYYLADLSLYFATNVDNRIHYGPVLENLTYIYSKMHGYAISIGKIGNLECDFIVRNSRQDYAYIQVAMTIAAQNTEDREYAPLEKIRDSWPKYVLTLDPLPQRRSGIRHLNIRDVFLQNMDF